MLNFNGYWHQLNQSISLLNNFWFCVNEIELWVTFDHGRGMMWIDCSFRRTANLFGGFVSKICEECTSWPLNTDRLALVNRWFRALNTSVFLGNRWITYQSTWFGSVLQFWPLGLTANLNPHLNLRRPSTMTFEPSQSLGSFLQSEASRRLLLYPL